MSSEGNLSGSPHFSVASQLHSVAEDRCRQYARLVFAIVRRHIGSSFFQYDASFVLDGCFHAALSLAHDSGSEEEINICIQALRDMRWAFSKSDRREKELRLAWDQRVSSNEMRSRGYGGFPKRMDSQDPTSFFDGSSLTSERMRHVPPPLMIDPAATCLPDSAPNTALTEDGSWTGVSSGPSSYGAHSHRSSSGSPPFTVQRTHKTEQLDTASALMLAQVNEVGHGLAPSVYYTSAIADLDSTFAYSIIPPSASPPRSPHSFTPPRTGMSSTSVSGFADPGSGFPPALDASVFSSSVSPPGSAQSEADARNGAFVLNPTDKAMTGIGPSSYPVSFAAPQFFVSPR
jgi:hypothetical protein